MRMSDEEALRQARELLARANQRRTVSDKTSGSVRKKTLREHLSAALNNTDLSTHRDPENISRSPQAWHMVARQLEEEEHKFTTANEQPDFSDHISKVHIVVAVLLFLGIGLARMFHERLGIGVDSFSGSL